MYGCTLVQEHFTWIYKLSATATRVNIVFSEGNTHTALSKLVDISTLYVFCLFSKLPGQIVPVLQKSWGLCWPGEGFSFQGGVWHSSYGKAGAQKHCSSPGHHAHGLPLPGKQNLLLFGMVWVWRGRGEGMLGGSGCGEQEQAAQAISTAWFLGRKKSN